MKSEAAEIGLRRPPNVHIISTVHSGLAHGEQSVPRNEHHRRAHSRVGKLFPGALSGACFCINLLLWKGGLQNLKAWLDLKSRLDSRLVLSAEVGQALLQRHAAYVRQYEVRKRHSEDDPFSTNRAEAEATSQSNTENLHREIDDLTKEKAQLEKRLNQALVNNEVTEVSNKTILQELQEARETISRLTAHHARSVGWDTRLSAALKERDDMQQERDGETHRARLAESRFAALKEKTGVPALTAKLQAEVRRLQESLEEKRHTRLEFSETILQEAKSRLDSFRSSQVGLTAKAEEEELTPVLESLVQDNDILKRDNAELQHLLADTREDVNALQLELEEQRALAPPPRSGANTPHSRHAHTSSTPSLKEFKLTNRRRNPSIESRSRRISIGGGDTHALVVPPREREREPHTPDTARSPDSSFASAFSAAVSDVTSVTSTKWNGYAYGPLSPRSSHIGFEIEEDADKEQEEALEKSRGYKPLFLLTRSKGIQTDVSVDLSDANAAHNFGSGALSPSPLPSSISPYEHRSETSSFSEPHSQSQYQSQLSPSNSSATGTGTGSGTNTTNTSSSHLSLLLDRISHLFNRLVQADAHTLTARLNRQNLKVKPADVSHLSRTTISQIVSEALSLRTQFRGLLVDGEGAENGIGNVVGMSGWACTRKEVRVLLKLVKEVFEEMGSLRAVVNDVILDPGSAAKRVNEVGLGLGSKTEEGDRKKEEGGGEGVAAWMGPISKLFSPNAAQAPTGSGSNRNNGTGPVSGSVTTTGAGANRAWATRPQRFVPKLGPALAASATTVNVEFSGTGKGRSSVTSTFAVAAVGSSVPLTVSESTSSADASGNPGGSALMGIFAGAPVQRLADSDPWIVLPPAPPSASATSVTPSTSTSNMDSARTVRKVSSRIFGRVGLGVTASSGDANTNYNYNVQSAGVGGGTATIGRSNGRRNLNKLSRNVDAIIDPTRAVGPGPALAERSSAIRGTGGVGGGVREEDEEDEEPDYVPPLLERTLRRRGLSDSSIHSTFSSHGGDQPQSPGSPKRASRGPAASRKMPDFWNLNEGTSGMGMGGTASSMFQALSRTVQNLRLSSSPAAATSTATVTSAVSSAASGVHNTDSQARASAPSTPKKDKDKDKTLISSSTNSTSSSRDPSSSGASRISSPHRGSGIRNSAYTTTATTTSSSTTTSTTSTSSIDILPNLSLSSWAASNVADPVIASSLREESYLQRLSSNGGGTLRGLRRDMDSSEGVGGGSGRDFY
ncbi:hypothetical protein CPB84DRAFT_1851011 [Gymnopilus junonius]|uniref:Uncharacterized protein n=1 Tax=Gymnopilus junonius TaxID=109634 RepID=A0A9P5THX9_GYMJU|nr:hypothetical protein CPB84DRAFT_1851011 [Gymnopilus junonius]